MRYVRDTYSFFSFFHIAWVLRGPAGDLKCAWCFESATDVSFHSPSHSEFTFVFPESCGFFGFRWRKGREKSSRKKTFRKIHPRARERNTSKHLRSSGHVPSACSPPPPPSPSLIKLVRRTWELQLHFSQLFSTLFSSVFLVRRLKNCSHCSGLACVNCRPFMHDPIRGNGPENQLAQRCVRFRTSALFI